MLFEFRLPAEFDPESQLHSLRTRHTKQNVDVSDLTRTRDLVPYSKAKVSLAGVEYELPMAIPHHMCRRSTSQ